MGKVRNRKGLGQRFQMRGQGRQRRRSSLHQEVHRRRRNAVVVTDGDNKVLTVDNPDTLKGHEGHHVAVTGHVKGDSIHVESVKML